MLFLGKVCNTKLWRKMLEKLVSGCLDIPTKLEKSWSSWYETVRKYQLTKGKSWNSWYAVVRKSQLTKKKSWNSWYVLVWKYQLTKGKSWNSWYETVRRYQLDEEKARKVGISLL